MTDIWSGGHDTLSFEEWTDFLDHARDVEAYTMASFDPGDHDA